MKYLSFLLIISVLIFSCKKSTIGDDNKPKGFTTQTYIVPSYRMDNDTMVVTMKDTIGYVHLAWKAWPDNAPSYSNPNPRMATRITMITTTGRQIAKYVDYIKVDYHIDLVIENGTLIWKKFGYMQDGTFTVALNTGEIITEIEVYNWNDFSKPNL